MGGTDAYDRESESCTSCEAERERKTTHRKIEIIMDLYNLGLVLVELTQAKETKAVGGVGWTSYLF